MGASEESKLAQTPAQRKAAKQQATGVAQKPVIRNVTKALVGQPGKRLIIADNFYTSCALAISLMNLGFYFVGTHRNDRLGWPANFAFTQKTRPKSMARGTYRIAQCKKYPELVAVSWMDSKPVSMLATGCFVDMAIVNGFIIHRMKMKKDGQRVPTHAEYMRRLHIELLEITVTSLSSNMSAEDLVSGPIRTSEHQLQTKRVSIGRNAVSICARYAPQWRLQEPRDSKPAITANDVRTFTADTWLSATVFAERRQEISLHATRFGTTPGPMVQPFLPT
eukprot:jgi/Phyca11/130228/e_gw1.92.39.1